MQFLWFNRIKVVVQKGIANTMDSENSRLKTLISKEFTELLSTLEGRTETLKEIVTIFIVETPDLLSKIETCVHLKKWNEAAELIHQVKPRYGYFGLEAIMDDLSRWEMLLKQGVQTDHTHLIKHFKKITEEVTVALKETGFYQHLVRKEQKLPLAGKKIMIAEDDEINAKVFALFIKDTGASVILASSGEQALQAALEKKPDMIFMDIHTPFYNGLEAIKALRKNGITCPILSLSASTLSLAASTRVEERQNSLDAGANDFIVKPVSRQLIKDVLMKYLC
jgi:CheY-like chemotaxis protein